MSKLTLSVDDAVIARAKKLARKSGVSISRMVETYLRAVAENVEPQPAPPPILRSLRGALKNADPDAYRKHRDAKYR